jgi:molybdopterin converting factor small subunit
MWIKLFAGAREKSGRDKIEIDCTPPVTTLKIKQLLNQQYPELGSFTSYARLAINNRFVENELELLQPSIHDEIALIPPVSGG